jgi:1,4-alpha-glucan branching enzyme
VVCNFTPVPRAAYRLGVPRGGWWREILNSDGREYGGSGLGNLGGVQATTEVWRDRPATVSLMLPPLGMLFLKSEEG